MVQLFAFMFSLHCFIFCRCGFFSFDQLPCQPTEAQDHALVHHVDSLCRNLATISRNIELCDITLSDAHVTSQRLAPLQGTHLCVAWSHTLTLNIYTVK